VVRDDPGCFGSNKTECPRQVVFHGFPSTNNCVLSCEGDTLKIHRPLPLEETERPMTLTRMVAVGEMLAALGRDMPVEHVVCPGCGADKSGRATVRNGFPIVRCSSCESLYVPSRPLEQNLTTIYERLPQLSNGREGLLDDDPEEGRREAEYRLTRLLEFVKSGRLIDLGCGRGDFLDAAKAHFSVEGVDLTPRLRPNMTGLKVFKGRLEDAGLPENAFDVITAIEVIEHLSDPRRTVREIHRILKTGGYLLFQTGDPGSLRARLNLKTWSYLQPPVHLNFFSRKALRRMADSQGFEELKSWSFGRAPGRIPFSKEVFRADAVRRVFDWAAGRGLIGAMYIWRKTN